MAEKRSSRYETVEGAKQKAAEAASNPVETPVEETVPEKPKRIWRVSAPKELNDRAKRAGKIERWQPERLSVIEGIQQTSYVILAGYVIVIALSLYMTINGLIQLPTNFIVPTWFGLGETTFNKYLYLLLAEFLQFYLIYRDLIRRSLSGWLLFVPAAFCFANYMMIEEVLLRPLGL